MKRLSILFITMLMTLSVIMYGQDTYVGTIFGEGTPNFGEPPVPCPIMWFETTSGEYILNFDSHWVCDVNVIFNEGLYCMDEEVEIFGTVNSVGVDVYGIEHFELVVETITKLLPLEIFSGKIMSYPSPQLTPTPSAKNVLYIDAPGDICVTSYVLTVNDEWVWDESLIFNGIKYFINDEVEITGTTIAKLSFPMRPYVELEIATIEKSTIGIESLTTNNTKVYFNSNTQTIILEDIPKNQPLIFELLDIQGKVAVQKTNINNNTSIYTGKLAPGVYVYRLMQNGQVVSVGKLMVDK